MDSPTPRDCRSIQEAIKRHRCHGGTQGDMRVHWRLVCTQGTHGSTGENLETQDTLKMWGTLETHWVLRDTGAHRVHLETQVHKGALGNPGNPWVAALADTGARGTLETPGDIGCSGDTVHTC